MEELKNELLEIRGALNYGVLDGKIKNELYQSLIDRTEKALALCSSSLPLKEKETPTFEEWAVTNKYKRVHDSAVYIQDGFPFHKSHLLKIYEQAIKDSL